jgi:hypothetical protein
MNDPAPDHALPHRLFSDHDMTTQHRLLRILKTSFLTVTALAVGGATLMLADPRARITAITSPNVGAWAPSAGQEQAASPVQSAVEAQTASPIEAQSPVNQQPAAAAPQPAAENQVEQKQVEQKQAEPKQVEPKQADTAGDRDALFRQFQAWAQQHEGKPDQQPASNSASPARTARDPAEQSSPAQPPVAAQSGPAQTESQSPAQGARAPVRSAQKRQPAREPNGAHAEVDPGQKARAQAPHPRNVPARPQPVQETRVQEAPPQPAPAPTFMQQLFGVHN